MRPGHASAGTTQCVSSTRSDASGTRATSSTAWAITRISGNPSVLLSSQTPCAPAPGQPDLAQQLAAFQGTLPGSLGAAYLQQRGISLAQQLGDGAAGRRRTAVGVRRFFSCIGATRRRCTACGGHLRRVGLAVGLGAQGPRAGLRPRRGARGAAAVAPARPPGSDAGEAGGGVPAVLKGLPRWAWRHARLTPWMGHLRTTVQILWYDRAPTDECFLSPRRVCDGDDDRWRVLCNQWC